MSQTAVEAPAVGQRSPGVNGSSSSLLSADELELREKDGDSSVVTCRDLHPDTTWGPFPGSLQSEGSAADGETEVGALLLANFL